MQRRSYNDENISPDVNKENTYIKKSPSEGISPSPSPAVSQKASIVVVEGVECGDGVLVGKKFTIDQDRKLIDVISWANLVNGVKGIDWYNLNKFHMVILFATHPAAIVGIYYAITTATWSSLLFNYIYFAGCALGVTMGMHRLWSHKSFRAHPVLECILTFWATASFQYSVIDWCADHRVHHKYSETEYDPHNAQYGLFFSHVGWLLYNRDPKVDTKIADQDVSDLEAKPWLKFQDKFYYPLALICAILIPMATMIAFGETPLVAYCLCMLRLCCTLHETFCVNSIAHWEGSHDYDKNIWPVENYFVAWLCFGEGWHNFHHTFPNDYRTSDRNERYLKPVLNCSSFVIDICAELGLVTNRIKAPEALVRKIKAENGDH